MDMNIQGVLGSGRGQWSCLQITTHKGGVLWALLVVAVTGQGVRQEESSKP